MNEYLTSLDPDCRRSLIDALLNARVNPIRQWDDLDFIGQLYSIPEGIDMYELYEYVIRTY
jgi:hypothetical protein